MCKNFGEICSTGIGDIKCFRFSYSKSTGSHPLQIQASQAIPFQNGDGEFDITEIDITESAITNFQESDITESDITEKGNGYNGI